MYHRLMPLAVVNVAVHVLGLFMALVGMRPGSPLVPVQDRIIYLSHHPLGWSLGWGVWMLCDIAVLAFVFQTARQLRNDLAMLATGIMLAGVTVDLACDSLLIIALPHLAASQPVNDDIFLAVEKTINIVSLVMANGLITLSTAVLTLSIRNRHGAIPLITALGSAIFVFGMSLSAAGFTSRPWMTEWLTGPTILSYCVWCGLVALKLDRSGAAA